MHAKANKPVSDKVKRYLSYAYIAQTLFPTLAMHKHKQLESRQIEDWLAMGKRHRANSNRNTKCIQTIQSSTHPQPQPHRILHLRRTRPPRPPPPPTPHHILQIHPITTGRNEINIRIRRTFPPPPSTSQHHQSSSALSSPRSTPSALPAPFATLSCAYALLARWWVGVRRIVRCPGNCQRGRCRLMLPRRRRRGRRRSATCSCRRRWGVGVSVGSSRRCGRGRGRRWMVGKLGWQSCVWGICGRVGRLGSGHGGSRWWEGGEGMRRRDSGLGLFRRRSRKIDGRGCVIRVGSSNLLASL